MKCVYVAGPLSLGDQKENVRLAMQAGSDLLSAGYAPLVPHAGFFTMEIAFPHADKVWLDADLAWVLKADMVLRLPGPSAGADTETKLAEEHGIPVFRGTATEFLSRTRDA